MVQEILVKEYNNMLKEIKTANAEIPKLQSRSTAAEVDPR